MEAVKPVGVDRFGDNRVRALVPGSGGMGGAAGWASDRSAAGVATRTTSDPPHPECLLPRPVGTIGGPSTAIGRSGSFSAFPVEIRRGKGDLDGRVARGALLATLSGRPATALAATWATVVVVDRTLERPRRRGDRGSTAARGRPFTSPRLLQAAGLAV